MSADEYEPLARKMADYIGMELMDPTTFEVSRLMYWPSCCSDSQYIYTWKDKPLLSANDLLAPIWGLAGLHLLAPGTGRPEPSQAGRQAG